MPPPPPLLPMPQSIVGACVPRVFGVTDMRKFPPEGMPIDHPAIEMLPEFFGRIEPSALPPACRTFNGSLCRNGDLRLLAYREEDWHGMNRIVMAQRDADSAVPATHPSALPPEMAAVPSERSPPNGMVSPPASCATRCRRHETRGGRTGRAAR